MKLENYKIVDFNYSHMSFSLTTLNQIDNAIYGSNTISVETYCEWVMTNPHITKYLYYIDPIAKNSQFIGYITTLPLHLWAIKDLIDGKLLENEIRPKHFKELTLGADNHLLIASILVVPKFQHTLAFKILYESIFSHLTELAKKGIFFDKVYADIISQTTAITAKKIGMKRINETNSFHYLQLHPLSFMSIGQNDKLFKKYYLENYPKKNTFDFEKKLKKHIR